MRREFPQTPLANVAQAIARPIAVEPGQNYRPIGVRLWGEGAYERDSIDGSQTVARSLSLVREDDLIINKIWVRSGSAAVATAAEDGCVASGEFPTFELNRDLIDPRWLRWLTRSRQFWAKCDALSHGTSGKNRIRPELFLTITVPLPDLTEQQQIVRRVEELAAKIEEARGLRREATRERAAFLFAERASVFHRAANKGTVRLDALATLQRGRFSARPRSDPRFFGGDHPWIQIGQIEESGKFIRRWTETLNEDGLAVSKKFPRGTLLISIAATIGAVGILAFDCCIPDSIVAVSPRSGVDTDYLYHYLNYLRSHLEEVAPQSAQKNVNLEILSALPVPNLKPYEQRHIAAQLDTVQTRVDDLARVQKETAVEIDALLPSVLDRAFRGEL